MIERGTFAALALGMAFVSPAAASADVEFGIRIGTPAPQAAMPPPPPPMMIPSPRVVKVPNSAVYYVPSASFNLFVFGDHYYSFHEGVWFHASTHNGPWVVIAVDRVPPPVVAVPVKYYRVPPGHAKKLGHGGPPGQLKKRHGHGSKWGGYDDD